MNDRLYRSRGDRMIGGVAGGIAEHWDLDPSLVRVGWALLIILTGGIFLLLYIVMWIVVPEEGSRAGSTTPPWPVDANAPAGSTQAEAAAARSSAAADREDARVARRAARAERRAARRANGENPAAIVGGAVLIVLGALFFLRELLPDLDLDLFWPVLLIGLGVVVLVLAFGRDGRSSGSNGSPS
jgi:phage shock protein PspC (stress-responsive transcriptional regulator)